MKKYECSGSDYVYECQDCGYIYDENLGAEHKDHPARVKWHELPDSVPCPDCLFR